MNEFTFALESTDETMAQYRSILQAVGAPLYPEFESASTMSGMSHIVWEGDVSGACRGHGSCSLPVYKTIGEVVDDYLAFKAASKDKERQDLEAQIKELQDRLKNL